MNFREDKILARDKALLKLEKLRDEIKAGKQVDYDLFERAVRECCLHQASLRLFEIYAKESDAHMGKWSDGGYITWARASDALSRLADLGEVMFDIKYSHLTNRE